MALANERQGDGASKLSADDREDLAAMNAAIDRMRAFTPADPYVLTIPQDVEPRYHHQYAIQARQWLEHTPFEYREHESTQYQTFVYHEPGKEMYMLHSSRPPDTETAAHVNRDRDKTGKEKPATGANTPNAGPKKVMSLHAYKKKQTGQTPEVAPAKELGKSMKKPAAKGPVERLREDEEVLAAVEEDSRIQVTEESVPNVEEQKGLKRKREDVPGKQVEQHKKGPPRDTPQDVAEPVSKKLKPATPAKESASQPEPPSATTPPAEVSQPGEENSSAAKDRLDEERLPPKLFPPPQLSEDEVLPPRLSPIDSRPALPRFSSTISTSIKATLKAQTHLRPLSQPSDMPKDAVGRTLTPPPTKPVKKKSPAPRNGFRANSSSPAVRSDVEERGRPATSMPRKLQLSDAESGEDSEEIAVLRRRKDGTHLPTAEKARPEANEAKRENHRLLVKLKFKKSSRDRLRALLRTKPMPSKSLAYQSDSSKAATNKKNEVGGGSNAKGVAKKIGPAQAINGATKKSAAQQSLERKRSLPDESESEEEAPLTKRNKTTAMYSQVKKNAPATPSRSDVRSPSSARKSGSQLSPDDLRKDVLSVSMKRDLSTDSAMHTPNATAYSPPASLKDASQIANGTAKPPSSQPSSKTPKQQAWDREHKRLEGVGRAAKHAVPTAARKEGAALTSDEKKLAAINALESVLAFMLAFTCADEAALASDPVRPPSTKPWISLQKYFGFVKNQCEPFFVLQGLACYLGIVFNAHILELMSQQSEDNTSVKLLLETQTMMKRAAHDTESKLDIDTLQSAFPRTWAARHRGALEQTKLEPGKSFTGGFKLPIGMQSSPLHAVRAGCAMLEEWIRLSGLDYAMKLKL